MNRIRTGTALAAIVIATGAAALVAGQPGDKKQEAGSPPAMSPEMQAMMAAYEAAGKPGVQHELFKEFAGTWDATVTMWMPGVPEPSVSKGTMVNTLIHGGRYLHHEYKGDFDGQTFTGSGQWGYNNLSKRWEGTWMDSMSTAIQFSTGKFDGQRGEWTMSGEFDHPMGYRATQREVITMRGRDAHTMASYVTGKDGKEQRVMEISYARKAAAGSGAGSAK